MLNPVLFSSKTPVWETPQALFDELDREFHFETDVCALPENAKCRRYFTPEVDGLKQEWTGVCWCNPPYGRAIADWVKKATESKATTVMLLPNRTDMGWFHEYVLEKAEVRFIRGRLKFGGAKYNAPFGSMIVIFRNEEKRNMEYTKEKILKLAEDLERCSDPTHRCIGCSFDAACEKENGTATLTAAAAVIRWQMQQLEYQTAVAAHLREMNVVRSLDCARDDRGFGDQDDRGPGQDVEKTMLSCDRAGDAGKGQAWQVGLYERAIKQWGEEAQIKKAVEELGELIVELARALNAGGVRDEHMLAHIREELADACIMCDQMQLIFGDVSDWEMYKLERLERKLERGL